jgi:hypothetical protein
MFLQVLEIEAPIHVELATKRVATGWGIARVGNRVSAAIDQVVMRLQGEGIVRKKSGFLWLVNKTTPIQVRRPDPLDAETQRFIKFIPPEEVELAIENTVRDALSLTWADLVALTARVLGFNRTGDEVRLSIEKALKRMLRAGSLTENGDRISVTGGLSPIKAMHSYSRHGRPGNRG